MREHRTLMCMRIVCRRMTTTVRLNESVRDKLQRFKNKEGMTYNGAVMRLLEFAETVSEEKDDGSATEHTTSTLTMAEDDGHTELPEPQGFFREGASGAAEFATRIIRALLTGAGEWGSTANHAVWTLYGELEIEPRIADRTDDPTPPNLDDLIEHLSKMVENPAEYTLRETEYEVNHVQEQGKRIQRALLMYQKMRNELEIPLESENAPSLTVPRERTYRGEIQDQIDIVTADGEKLDPRPDLNSGVTSFSWGYRGTGPSTLATALLADAYPDRYARARSRELTDNFTTQLPMGKPWEIQASELEQYINTE